MAVVGKPKSYTGIPWVSRCFANSSGFVTEQAAVVYLILSPFEISRHGPVPYEQEYQSIKTGAKIKLPRKRPNVSTKLSELEG